MDSLPVNLMLCVAIYIHPELLKISVSGKKNEDSLCVTGALPFLFTLTKLVVKLAYT